MSFLLLVKKLVNLNTSAEEEFFLLIKGLIINPHKHLFK